MYNKLLTTTALALTLTMGTAMAADDKSMAETKAQADTMTEFEMMNEPGKMKGQVSAEALIGTDILNSEGEDIGDVEDILINVNGAGQTHVLIELDGNWLGADKHVAIPLKDLKGHENAFMTSHAKADLEGMEGWEQDGLRWLTVAEYEAEMETRQAMNSAERVATEARNELGEAGRDVKEGLTNAQRAAEREMGETRNALTSYNIETNQDVEVVGGYSADELDGAEIVNANGDVLGEIEDVIIGKGGKADHVIVGLGGFLGLGERHVLVPLDSLERQDDDTFVSTKTKADIEGMTAYRETSEGWAVEADAEADAEMKTNK